MAFNMKIMLVGSMKFAHEMVDIKKRLQEMGYESYLPFGTEPHLNDKTFVDRLGDNLDHVIKEDIMWKNFDQVAKSDGILVINNRRNNVDGFIGISALMEMGIAFYLKKKIYLLNPYPSFEDHRWAQEVACMQPIVLNGDLTKII